MLFETVHLRLTAVFLAFGAGKRTQIQCTLYVVLACDQEVVKGNSAHGCRCGAGLHFRSIFQLSGLVHCIRLCTECYALRWVTMNPEACMVALWDWLAYVICG